MSEEARASFECRAILFDLDGTLIDSIAAVDRAWGRWAVRHGLDPRDVVPHIHGRRAVDSLRLLAPRPDIDLSVEEEWLVSEEAGDTEGVTPIPGALEFVASIAPDRWCLVTSGTRAVATARMQAVGLRARQAVFGEDVENGKPAPDPYLLAASRMGRQPHECLVFEDTAAGIRSGQTAGMRVVAIGPREKNLELGMADAIVQDYRTLFVEQTGDGLRVCFVSEK